MLRTLRFILCTLYYYTCQVNILKILGPNTRWLIM